MKKTLLAVLVAAPLLCSAATADTTFGIGAGSLYSGLGVNLGRTTDTSLTFGALGCVGFSSAGSETRAGDGSVERSNSHDSNCGVGIGHVSTALLPGNRQGLGLSLGYTYDTGLEEDGPGGSQWRLAPSYHYFFSGIDQRGLTFGIGPQLVMYEGGSTAIGPMINLGFQF